MPQPQPQPARSEHVPYRTAVANKPFKFEAFPAAMYHEDGRCFKVESEEDALARCPPDEGWQDKAFPPKPIPVPVPEPTVAELKAQLAAVTEERDKLTAVCAEHMLQISDLRAKAAAKVEAAKVEPAEEAPAAHLADLGAAPSQEKRKTR